MGGSVVEYLGKGLAASRPASPSLSSGAIGLYWATDDEELSLWDGSSWRDDILAGTGSSSVTSVNGATGAVVLELDKVTINTETSTSTMTPATHAGLRKYNRCADDVTFSSGQSYTAGDVYNIRATAALSLVESGVTLTEPAGGTLDLDAGMSVTVIMTSSTAGDVIGQTVPA